MPTSVLVRRSHDGSPGGHAWRRSRWRSRTSGPRRTDAGWPAPPRARPAARSRSAGAVARVRVARRTRPPDRCRTARVQGPDACLHLLSLLSPLDVDPVVAYPPLMPIRLLELLADRGISIVEVPEEEFGSMGRTFSRWPRASPWPSTAAP